MALCGVKGTRLLGPNVYLEAPDGGWGWVVSVAFFFVAVFTYGTIKIFGIFLQDIMDEMGETNSRVSWIVSICVFVMAFNAPLSSMMTSRFGFQLVVMVGGFFISAGTIASSFTTSVNQMYISYGLIAGLGYSLTFLPTVTILSQYFTRRRALVTAVASTGEPLTMFALAPAFSALKAHIGWRNTMAVTGALQSIVILCGALLRPIIIRPREIELLSKELGACSTSVVVEETNPEDCAINCKSQSQNNGHSDLTRYSGDSGVQFLKDVDNNSQDEETLLHEEARKVVDVDLVEMRKYEKVKHCKHAEEQAKEITSGDEKLSAKSSKLLDFSILKECSFLLYSLFGLFTTLGFFAPQLYIIELSVSRGLARDRAAYMLSTMAVAEIFGRFAIGWILTRRRLRKNKLLVLLACVIMITADLVGFTLVTEFYGLAVCCTLYGFFLGTIGCIHVPMLAEDEVVGIQRMSSAAGVYVFIQSFAGLAGPPLGGLLVDLTQDYGSAFYSCAVGMGLSALFLGLVKPAKKGLLCVKGNPRRPEDTREKEVDTEEHSAVDKLDKRHDSSQEVDQAEATRDVKDGVGLA